MFHPSDSGEILEMSGRVRTGFVGSDWFGVGFGSSSVRFGFGSVPVMIFGFWFSCQPTFKFDGETTTWSHSRKFSTHQTQVRLFTKGERRGSRGLSSALKSAKKFKTLLKLCTTTYLLCIFSAITQITYLTIIFSP